MASHESSTPVTRIACFAFKPNVASAEKANRTAAFLALYRRHSDLILDGPRGGRPLDTPLDLTNVKRETQWNTGFIVTFKNDEARKQFDSGPGHDELKNETDPLLERVFVYDFEEQNNLGW